MASQPVRVAHILGNEYAGVQKMVCTLVRELPHYSHTVIVNSANDGALNELRAVNPDVVVAHFSGDHPIVSIAARMPGVRTTFVVPKGCDVEEIEERAQAGRDSRLHDGAAGHRLLMVTWTSADCEVVIHAVALLRERGRDVQLSFAGGSNGKSTQDDLEKLALELGVADAVTFLGVRSDVPELMGASDVVIQAAQSEGFSLVVAEAFAARTPVVASDIPSYREMLDNGRCGVLVPPADHIAIANGVQALLTNTLHRRTVVNAALKRVNELYDTKRMAAAYASLIDAATRSP